MTGIHPADEQEAQAMTEEALLDEVSTNPNAVLATQIDRLVREMQTITVDSDEKSKWLTEWVKRNKETQKIVNAAFEDERVKRKAEYDAVIDARKLLLKPLESAEAVARTKLSEWVTVVRRKADLEAAVARVAAQKANEEARKKAEDERIQIAEELVENGKFDRADAILAKEIKVEKVKVATSTTVIPSSRKKITPTVVNLKLLLAEIVAGRVTENVITINMAELGTLVKIAEFENRKIPGVAYTVSYSAIV